MKNEHMILDEEHNLVPVDMMTWAVWFEENHDTPLRVVCQQHVGAYYISTVFLGLDHSFGGGKPLWFETMVFGKGEEHDGYQNRYETWAEAEAGHKEAVEAVTKPV